MHLISQIAVIIGAACISEDLTLIAVALLIRNLEINWLVGLCGGFLGIFVGDLALWALGRWVGRRALAFAWVAQRLPPKRLDVAGDWFDRRGFSAMIAARFLPGMRFPLYFSAGVIGRNTPKVIGWTLIAAAIWTPLFITAVLLFGESLIRPLQRFLGAGVGGGVLALMAGAVAYVCWYYAGRVFSQEGRRTLALRWARVRRWEFWPAWLFYLPIVPYLAWLSLRHRGITTFTAANPGIPSGGVVDESKADILSRLPKAWVLDFRPIAPGVPEQRLAEIQSTMAKRGWTFPLIFKPDHGYRGASVRIIRSLDAARAYLARHLEALVVQVFHPGPYEAGIFYYRLPHESHGHVFSITDKQFARLIGDGKSTLEELIVNHPRYRMQAGTFLRRHAEIRKRVFFAGEEFPLALAGNHCQGTMFKDGSHLITPALTARIDEIARHFQGFYFGRFDVRYSDPAAFKAGTDLSIIELNGVTSESTNLYDPSWSILRAYRTLASTWRIAFSIGSANRRAGFSATPLRELYRSLRHHYRHAQLDPLSD